MPLEHEKRQHPRLELFAQVQVARESEVHIMSAQQISHGGIFVQGEPAAYPDLQVGTQVEVVVFDADNPGREDLSLAARIVRIEGRSQGSDTELGFGLQFTELGSFEAGALESLLERLKGPQA